MNVKQYIGIGLKGMAMGIAEVIPGVSGGTIAFIVGIYERLLNSIRSFGPGLLSDLKSGGIKAVWNTIDGNFLVALLAGMGIGIVVFANLIGYLLINFQVLLWAFFFGLILSSCLFVGKKLNRWGPIQIITCLTAVAVAYYVTLASPSEGSDALWWIFICGAIAISALMLPGLSGSFILLLLGMYRKIIYAVRELDVVVLIVFGLGLLTGLFSFAHVIGWAFKNHRDTTLAILTGFMFGSLNKIWPWRNVLEYRVRSSGEKVPFLEESVLPTQFEGETFLIGAIVLMVIGFASVFILEKVNPDSDKLSAF